jgi:sulfate/thiosulfate transport system permease protein
LALGFSLAYLTLIILIPLAGLAWPRPRWADFRAIATDRRVVQSLELSFGASLIAAAVKGRVRLDRRLGARTLPFSRPPHR